MNASIQAMRRARSARSARRIRPGAGRGSRTAVSRKIRSAIARLARRPVRAVQRSANRSATSARRADARQGIAGQGLGQGVDGIEVVDHRDDEVVGRRPEGRRDDAIAGGLVDDDREERRFVERDRPALQVARDAEDQAVLGLAGIEEVPGQGHERIDVARALDAEDRSRPRPDVHAHPSAREGPVGFEPTTRGLKVPCSAAELRARREG